MHNDGDNIKAFCHYWTKNPKGRTVLNNWLYLIRMNPNDMIDAVIRSGCFDQWVQYPKVFSIILTDEEHHKLANRLKELADKAFEYR